MLPYSLRAVLALAIVQSSMSAFGADSPASITIWNANVSQSIAYQPLTPQSKAGDWVYVEAGRLHPTQFSLGYREVTYKAKVFSSLPADLASHDPKGSVYPYLARKDIPIIVAPDGTFYLTDGHHTMAALLASTQADKRTFGHVVANYFGKPQKEFLAFICAPANNDVYLYGPSGNGLLNAPAALEFDRLPATVYSANPAARMANDPYRSLGWAIKEVGYSTKAREKRGEDESLENFVEFRWADLLRDKIVWNDRSDDSFYLATANANALARSELTTDLSCGIAARDLPGFRPAKKSDTFNLFITDDTLIKGDIAPSAKSTNTLTIRSDSLLVLDGKLSNFAAVRVNAPAKASVAIENGDLSPIVDVPAGTGAVVFAGDSSYKGVTQVAAGRLVVNGNIENSRVELASGATLRGSGRVGTIAGDGTVLPGNLPGILTAAAVEPSRKLGLSFEFTAPSPGFDQPMHSRNSVLVLTDEAPLKKPLEATNDINIYLHVDAIHAGDAFTGGIFARTSQSFLSEVSRARLHYFVADAGGPVQLGGTHYSELQSDKYAVVMNVVPTTVAMGAGTANGFITTFTVSNAPAR